jgi:pimeloyl-ACP methyl ester carboxylesterase
MNRPEDTPLLADWGRHRPPPPPRRRRLPRRAWVALALAAAALVAALVPRSHGWEPPSGSPRFASCTYGGYVSAWCGRLDVPEDPRRPKGATISLRVAILPATTKPAAGALFYLEGGPGVPATRSAVQVNALFAQVGRLRDIVMVDQRGTGGSDAAACANERVNAADAAAVSAYVASCFARLRGNPRLYTTSVAADDLEAVRRALGYGKVDVYGGSYGSTLAQAYVRQFPHSVRSAVLDSGSLPDVRLYDAEVANAQRALDVALARCAAVRACHVAYPHTRRQLAELLARPPRTVKIETGRVVLTPDAIAWTVALLSQTANGTATIPFTIDAAVRGNELPLARAYHDEVGANLDARSRLAAVWVILCSEPWARFDMIAGRGSYLAAAARDRARVFEESCRNVPKGRVPAGAGRIEASRVPTLLLAGGADPLDPPPNLRGWRRAFPRGRLVVVPGAGHGAIFYGCVPALVAQFVARGSTRGLDADCVRRVALPAFEVG